MKGGGGAGGFAGPTSFNEGGTPWSVVVQDMIEWVLSMVGAQLEVEIKRVSTGEPRFECAISFALAMGDNDEGSLLEYERHVQQY
jgi:hypothetical protein